MFPIFLFPQFETIEIVQAQELTIEQKIDYYAEMHNVDPLILHTVVKCESSYNTLAVGDSGNSRGLVQIHKKYWKDITDEMAFDPDFSLNFLAEKISEGKGSLWSCFRSNFGVIIQI